MRGTTLKKLNILLPIILKNSVKWSLTSILAIAFSMFSQAYRVCYSQGSVRTSSFKTTLYTLGTEALFIVCLDKSTCPI